MSESIWKKEIRLRKPRDQKVVEAAVAQTEAQTSHRKRVHVRRRPEALPPLPPRLLDAHRAPRGTIVVPVVPGRTSASERFAREFDAWAARVVAPAGDEQPPPTASEEDTLTELDAVPMVGEPDRSSPWEFKPAQFKPKHFEVETPPALRELSSAVPVPEVELASEPNRVPEFPAHQEKVPLLKRELHFRRLKAEKPAKVKQPKEKTPLLKREIHFRKPKVESKELGSDATVPMLELAPPSSQVPGFSELHTEPAQEFVVDAKPAASVEMVSDTAVVSDTSSDSAPKEKVPLLKREIHLRKPKAKKAPQEAKSSRRSKSDGGHNVSRVVGLRIGSSQISAAHVRNNGSAEVVQLARVGIERGLVVAGEVREPVALAKALKSFFAANKLPRKDIRLGVASNRIGVRVLQVPAIDDAKQFENAIRFRAQEALPIPITDAVLDHVVLGEETTEEGETVRNVLLVFAHRDLVARYVDVCNQAGLRLAAIDLDAFALLRAVGPAKADETRRATVAVGIGHERTVFAVSDGEICDFARVLEWGSGAVDVAIARALNLAPSQATSIKHVLDLNAPDPPEGLSPMQFEAARAAARTEVAHLARELVSSVRFYQSRPGSLDLAEIVLSGGGAQLGGLAAEVQRGLGAPVRVADPFGRVTLAKRISVPGDSGSLAIAVGLGIES